MDGEPVQILRVKNGHDIEFNESELERILLADHVKDRPVVVISVAGGYRQGKSFLLSFFLRYLRNNGRSDWMGDVDTPLRGFQWRPGSTRETTGILLWNEVFLMTNSKGEEVAVLLMDTQGIFNPESTFEESTMIFVLSIMTSSVQIYNVMNNVNENDLEHLQYFADYGRLAQKGNETKPFQKLLFLVRDWERPQNFEFGSRGGKSLINTRLEIKATGDAEQRTLRQSIISCFSDIDGFLLPRPGDKVSRETSFDGRLADISKDFLEKLQELVASILAPENLLVKQVIGKKISCEHLMTFFRTYVEVFKGGDLPEPESMLLATAKATNVAAAEKALTSYMSGMRDMPRGCLARLHEFHREKLTEAKKVFDDFPKLGGDAVSRTFMDAFLKKADEAFDGFFKAEKEIIRREQEVDAKIEKERQEQREREEQMKSEQMLEKVKAEAREAGFKREMEFLKEQQTIMQERAQGREREVLNEQKARMDHEIREKEMELYMEKMKNELLQIKFEQATNNPPACTIS